MKSVSSLLNQRMKCQAALPICVAIPLILGGCQSYRDFETRGSNAFHDITLEVSPDVSRAAKIDDLKIERKARAGASFVVTGDITYGKSCTAGLMIGISFFNGNGVALKNAKGIVQSYVANTRSRFQTFAHIDALVGETKDIIDKVVLTDIKCA